MYEFLLAFHFFKSYFVFAVVYNYAFLVYKNVEFDYGYTSIIYI